MAVYNKGIATYTQNRYKDSLFVNNKQSITYLFNVINYWKNHKDWYIKHNIPYKLGILLYGKPGTGKTTLAKIVASELNCKINITSLVTEYIKNNNSETAYNSWYDDIKDNFCDLTVYLIEDIDLFFTDRNHITTESQKSNFNKLFQLLDGINSPSNAIIIATTNYRERLDEALIRPGRFDMQLEMQYFNYNTALELTKSFGYDNKVLDSFNLTYPVQPALLQSKLIEYSSSQLYSKINNL